MLILPIQGLLWSLISIYCVAVYDCILDNPLVVHSENVNVYTLLYASYFNGSACNGGPNFNGLTEPAPSSLRTYYWMIGYAILSAIWIPVSILLIASGVTKVRGVCGSYFYLPWILFSIIIAVTDVVAVVFYSIDISKTMSADDYVIFLGARGTWQSVTDTTKTGKDPAAPAVIMTLFFSRFIIFWFLNTSLIFHCIKESRSIQKFNLEGSITSSCCNDDERFRTWNHTYITKQDLNVSKRKLNRPSAPANRVHKSKKNGGSEVNINEERNIIHETTSHIPELESSQTNPRILYKVDEFGIPIEEIMIPRVQNYCATSSCTGSEIPAGSSVFDCLERPANTAPHRYTTEHPSGAERSKSQNLYSQELRGQAPWSYLHPCPPPQPAPPTIPTPDYANNPQQQLPYQQSRRTSVKKPYGNHRVHGLQ
ncbi:uncharacterized protein LOC142328994 isoform X2 [Lycorma delicatula]|uniref:uncharacterized protein LOC142328994 isoform X2 n=1 Tax=Lycorma delicatula TaxID=130591 RepID=UPI003F517399